MTFQFTHPMYLWGVVLLLIIVYAHYKSLLEFSRFQRNTILSIRIVGVLLLLGALAGLTVRLPSNQRETIFLVDTSRSVDDSAKNTSQEYIRKTMKSDKNTQYRTLYFSQKTDSVRNVPDGEKTNNVTDIEQALMSALAMTKPEVKTQLVLLSDGNETKGDAISAARVSGIPINTIPLAVNTRPEVQLAGITVPASVRKGEPFRVDAYVRSNVATSGKLSIFRNGHRINAQNVSLISGSNSFSCELEGNEMNEIELVASIETEKDTIIDNNTKSAFVLTKGYPKVLLMAKDPDMSHEFVNAMKQQSIHLEVRPSGGLPDRIDQLAKYDLLIVSDIPSTSMSLRQMEMIRNYVADLGGGFLMLGGENAFGLGGYDKTPLAEIFPVDTRFEKEKEKPALAMGLVIDRSGSMEGEKLALTKDAAKGAVELLSAHDYITVIGFDSIAHKIVPLQKASTPSVINQMIGVIQAQGGTNIYGALNEACNELQRADAKFKHLILLTDGHSSPGDYDAIVRRLVHSGITVSTVGLGNSDRFLLEKLAKDGHGRFYSCEDPRSVPQIFARETSMADRSALNEKPFIPIPKSVLPLLKNIPLDQIPPLLGNVIVRPKNTSEVHLETESGDPLLSSWRYGLGISAAFTSDVNGRWSSEWLSWPEFARFWAQVIRYAMRNNKSASCELRIIPFDGKASVILDARNAYGEFLNDVTCELTVITSSHKKTTLQMLQNSPGQYEAVFPFDNNEKYILNAVVNKKDGNIMSSSRTFTGDSKHELDVLPVNTHLLKQIAEVSGGQYDLKPEEIVKSVLPINCHKVIVLRQYFLLLALMFFVLDVYLRRFSFSESER